MVATALYTGLRISELLGLVWDDVNLASGLIRVSAQLSRAHRGMPARRVAPKTAASVREIPLFAQLARLLAEHKLRTPYAQRGDWVFATARGTPHGRRNMARRGLGRAAERAGLNGGEWPALRFHDLRHTFASHLIVDLGSMSRKSAGSLGTRASRSPSTSTRISSTTLAIAERSAPAWRQAPTPGYSTVRQV
jgi:integrase